LLIKFEVFNKGLYLDFADIISVFRSDAFTFTDQFFLTRKAPEGFNICIENKEIAKWQ